MITIKPIQFGVILREAALLAEYGAECSVAAIGPINPQPEIYAALERAGVMCCLAVLRDGCIVGFANVLVNLFPHYGRKVATVESLFVAKAHRNTAAGISLMTAVEAHAMSAGCVGVLYSAPAYGKFERLLSRRAKYRRTNTVFFRSLP